MIRKTLLAVAIAGLTAQAQAANVSFNFNSDGFDAGTLAGQTLTGQFSFDDDTLSSATEWLSLSSFSFTLGGQTYVLAGAQLDAAVATFSDGLLVGVEAVATGVGSHDFSFFTSFGAPSVLYTDISGSDVGAANLSITAVPEPESYALMLCGLGIVGWLTRRRKA